MYNMIIEELENIANTLENRGMTKEASEIDAVCNSIEALQTSENSNELINLLKKYGLPDESTFNEIKNQAVTTKTAGMPSALKKTIGITLVSLLAAFAGKSISDVKYNDLIEVVKSNPAISKSLEVDGTLSVKEQSADPHVYFEVVGTVSIDNHLLEKFTGKSNSIDGAKKVAEDIAKQMGAKYKLKDIAYKDEMAKNPALKLNPNSFYNG